jgi:hypothetical protein
VYLMRTRIILQALCIQGMLAISISQASAGCLNPPLAAQSISQFKSNPQALVAPSSDARTIEALVRDLAGTDASLAADLVHVAEGTIPRFQTAIAAGLAQAATACASVDQKAALLIQQAVAGFQDGQFQASFAAVAGDLSTAAIEAASASASGSAGSVVIVNPNSSKSFPIGGGGGAIAALTQIASPGFIINSPTGTETTTTNTANSVSPTR